MSKIFVAKGKKHVRFIVKPDRITLDRTYKRESYGISKTEYNLINDYRTASSLFAWLNTHGLQHRRPHPLGFNLYDLTIAHAKRYAKLGQPHFEQPTFEEFFAESKMYAERDGKILLSDGAIG